MSIPNRTFSNIQLRRGAAAIWTANNPILLSGEVGIETDTNKLKIGNGTDAWNDLDYFVGGGSVSLELDQLTDVNITGVADGDALVYDAGTSTWVPGESASSVFVSDTAPTSPSGGDLWFDSTNGNTYIYYTDADSSQWVGFGGGSSGYVLGTIYPWPTETVPSWALELNGQAVSRTTYSGLFALIGTTYGVGDGSTTFNLPNYRGRVLVGQDTGQSEFNVIGETGGAKTHTLTIDEMPSHTHVQNAHLHDLAGLVRTTGSGTTQSGAGIPPHNNTPSADQGLATVDSSSTTATNQNTGGGQAHNNLQPYTVVKWIICAATSAGEYDTEVQTALVAQVADHESRLDALETDSGWQTPTFQNSWVNFGSPYQNARYRKINGLVYIQGTVKTGASGTTIFTLPTGYRPPADLQYSIPLSGNAVGRLDITSAGAVVATNGNSTATSINIPPFMVS